MSSKKGSHRVIYVSFIFLFGHFLKAESSREWDFLQVKVWTTYWRDCKWIQDNAIKSHFLTHHVIMSLFCMWSMRAYNTIVFLVFLKIICYYLCTQYPWYITLFEMEDVDQKLKNALKMTNWMVWKIMIWWWLERELRWLGLCREKKIPPRPFRSKYRKERGKYLSEERVHIKEKKTEGTKIQELLDQCETSLERRNAWKRHTNSLDVWIILMKMMT